MDSSKTISNTTAPWFLTVIRTQGMRLMRSDREWRPLVTIDVRDLRHRPLYPEHEHGHDTRTDQPQAFETLMGVDGQNPNLKHGLDIPGPIPSTTPSSASNSLSASSSTLTLSMARPSPGLNARLVIGVWYTPPAQGKRKAKSKKRVLVGSAELGVGELLKMWEKERGRGKGALDLRLTCHSPTKGAVSSRNGALLTIRLHPPPAVTPSTVPESPVTEVGTEEGVGRSDVEEHSGAEDGHDKMTETVESDYAPAPAPAVKEPPSTAPTSPPPPSSPSDTKSSDPIPTPILDPEPAPAPKGLRRRHHKPKLELKGYAIDSDPCPSPSPSSSSASSSSCKPHSEEEDEQDERERERARFLEQWCRDADAGATVDENGMLLGEWCRSEPGDDSKPTTTTRCTCLGSCICTSVEGDGQNVSVGWVAASLLPQHTLRAGPSGVLENEAAAAWRAQMRSASMAVSLAGGEGEDEKAALPAYTERVEVKDPDALTLPERILATFTLYAALRAAQVDTEFEAVFARLQMEWGYVGGLLVALAAVNTAVLSISPDAVFTVHAYARGAVAASSVASGLGIACDAWFLLRYGWAEVGVVRKRALDVFNTYFFFALSARTPSLCMFTAALALMAFLALVAFDAWPGGSLVVCGLVGAVMGLQFLVWGAVWVGKGVRGGVRGVGRGVRGVVGAGRGVVGRSNGRVNVMGGEKGGR